MNILERFKKETPRIVTFLQMVTTSITSISGTLAVMGIVLSPPVATIVAGVSGTATLLLQLINKKE